MWEIKTHKNLWNFIYTLHFPQAFVRSLIDLIDNLIFNRCFFFNFLNFFFYCFNCLCFVVAEIKGPSQRDVSGHPSDRPGCEPDLQGSHHVHAPLRRQVSPADTRSKVTAATPNLFTLGWKLTSISHTTRQEVEFQVFQVKGFYEIKKNEHENTGIWLVWKFKTPPTV